MILRRFREADAAVICKWLRTEKELYQWSADRFNKYPLTAEDIRENYLPQMQSGRFIPLCAEDDAGHLTGHFIIRYPNDDKTSVRFGFVILDPERRGQGLGQEMLRHGMQYARETLRAARIDLGVFANNAPAKRCYEALGFREYQRRSCEMPIGTWECIDMEISLKDTSA